MDAACSGADPDEPHRDGQPQSGVTRCPGVLDLLDAAVREGADLVGGIDPLEIDRDPKSLPLA